MQRTSLECIFYHFMTAYEFEPCEGIHNIAGASHHVSGTMLP